MAEENAATEPQALASPAPSPATEAVAAPATPASAADGGAKNLKGKKGGDSKEVADGTSPTGPVSNPLALRHERLTGTISKYIPSSGYGFVRSHLFEGELGFKTESIMLECQSYEFQESEAVEFDVQSDERGRPHAVALKPVVGRKPNECLGQRHRGYVRRFADRWGFLNAAAFDGDLFVHRDNLLLVPDQMQDGQAPLRAGQAVEFDVAQDDRGRCVAKQITTHALLRPCDWINHRLRGYIRSFQGAWGFINSERFAGDLFVHRDSLLAQFQGVDLTVGTVVEFDVERDHHKKGGKNRLVARQVAVTLQPGAVAQQQAGYPGQMQQASAYASQMQQGVPDPMLYSTMPPQSLPGYGSGLNPQAANFTPLQSPPMYYGTQPDMQQQHLAAQMPSPYPYGDPAALYGAAQQAAAGVPPYPGQPPMPGMPQQQYPQMQQMTQPPVPHPMGQVPGVTPPLMGQPQYGMPQMATPQYGMPQMQYGQPLASAAPQPVPTPQPMGIPPAQPTPPAQPQAQVPGAEGAPAEGAAAGDQPQVLLHITTHDWEPDQSGQLRVRKGTLVNVSHRAAHGWVYAATVQPDNQSEPAAEGWVPQAVAKRVSLCRVAVEWPAEGSGTLGLAKGDLIAVSKEAERGWVFGERISPRRQDPADGWLPKKVLEYVII
mmetsp:Transcript_57760/g.125615  ORF Transcript_57760/g.125615 Transcript_57760/m.125615 type:complete len:660 (-) Transcript_57760:178-2157(-)